MASFAISASEEPVSTHAWSIVFAGTKEIQFNGALLASCLRKVIECASVSGCLSDKPHLTERCAQTFAAHNLEAGCADAGFGIKVFPSEKVAALVASSNRIEKLDRYG